MRNSTPFHLRFYFSIRTFRGMSKSFQLSLPFTLVHLCFMVFGCHLVPFVVLFAFSAWLKLVVPCRFRNFVLHFNMDHTQSREFHHHLACAIMHSNCLAGFLPFFEPAIEWDDPMGEPHTRTGRSNPAQRNLHTFVPLPSSSSASTMVSHGGIPTHMILNPEPNLRPLSVASRPRNDEVHPATFSTLRHPHQKTRHPSPPTPHSTALTLMVEDSPAHWKVTHLRTGKWLTCALDHRLTCAQDPDSPAQDPDSPAHRKVSEGETNL